jgi:hypothetical protein
MSHPCTRCAGTGWSGIAVRQGAVWNASVSERSERDGVGLEMGNTHYETEYVTLIAGLFDAVRWYSKRVKI